MPKYHKSLNVPGKSAAQLYELVSSEIERFLEKTPIGKHEILKRESSSEIEIKSTMFSGVLKCSEGQVDLNASLSLLAAPFKGKLDEGIERWAQKFLMT